MKFAFVFVFVVLCLIIGSHDDCPHDWEDWDWND